MNLSTTKVIILTIFVKLCIFVLIFVGFHTLPFNKSGYEVNFHYPEKSPITLQTAFKTWDGQHYLYLSEFWYKPNQDSNAFYPLFPFLIRLIKPFFNNPLYAGLFLSNILSTLGIIYLYLFIRNYFKNNHQLAFSSIVFLLAFPTSFYFSLVYSESLCFFLTILLFYFLYKNRLIYASIFAFLLPLSRPIGIFIIFPYAYYILHYLYSNSPKLVPRQRIKKMLVDHRLFLLLSPLAGLVLYFSIIYLATSSPTTGLAARYRFVSEARIVNIFHPDIFLTNLFSPIPAQHVYLNSGIDRIFFVFFIISLYFIYKKLDKTLFIYSLTAGFVPIFGSFMSYTRLLLLVFPVFMVSAMLFSSKIHRFYIILIILLMSILQIVFLINHALNYWVA